MDEYDRRHAAITAAQTIIDWKSADYGTPPRPGSIWRWSGQAIDLTPRRREQEWEGRLVLTRQAGHAGRLLLQANGNHRVVSGRADVVPYSQCFVLASGKRRFRVGRLAPGEAGGRDILVFLGEPPPRDTDLEVVATYGEGEARTPTRAPKAASLQLAAGTMVMTPFGPRPVEQIAPGDRVVTRDAGAQRVYWIGSRRISGARLEAMPGLRPLRIRAHAFGRGFPDVDTFVAPGQRLLLRGRAVEEAFATGEVLARCADMLDDRAISVNRALREVTCFSLMFETHQIIRANGLEVESFHPADCPQEALEPAQAAQMRALFPEIEAGAAGYGPHARKLLTPAQAAIIASQVLVPAAASTHRALQRHES